MQKKREQTHLIPRAQSEDIRRILQHPLRRRNRSTFSTTNNSHFFQSSKQHCEFRKNVVHQKKYFIQMACSVVEEKAWQREFGAFSGIPATDKKRIITKEDIDYSTSAVEHIRFPDFLMNVRSIE